MAAGRPQVWWLAAEPPDHGGTGSPTRQAYLLDALSDRADVHLLAAGPVTDRAVLDRLATRVAVDVAPAAPPDSKMARRVVDLAAALGARMPAEVRAYRPVARALSARLGELPPPSVVLVEHSGLAPMVPAARPVPWALTLQNVASGTAAQAATVASGARQRWVWRREQAKAARFERWAVTAYDLVIAVSDDDAARLPGRTAVVPNGVDLRRFAFAPLPPEPRIVLTGLLSYLPNVDGTLWFVREVLPAVRAAVPGVQLDIVGRSPVDEVIALEADGVRVHADVESTVPYLQAARVAVVPLRLGTGTRLKALEAMAVGRPVVGTSVGLAGLGVADGADALVADGASAFADAVVRALTDDALAARLATAGTDVAARHEWSNSGHTFTVALLGLIGETSGRRTGGGEE